MLNHKDENCQPTHVLRILYRIFNINGPLHLSCPVYENILQPLSNRVPYECKLPTNSSLHSVEIITILNQYDPTSRLNLLFRNNETQHMLVPDRPSIPHHSRPSTHHCLPLTTHAISDSFPSCCVTMGKNHLLNVTFPLGANHGSLVSANRPRRGWVVPGYHSPGPPCRLSRFRLLGLRGEEEPKRCCVCVKKLGQGEPEKVLSL